MGGDFTRKKEKKKDGERERYTEKPGNRWAFV